ncbi:hypothetical protein PC129_g16339 [Phytophthora cactorum]|uniref:Uncharacterized protein n=1 Tax=Phytophthora cactorum TaxID=29920 RepID=A0A8T1BU76_9STRA|nr:hypothetical protein PC112_g13986 [Phytophthora cactorum]KAG2816887.1 hypothetical protein PC111_g12955 [Phytophthora cactorum]KAG2852628.1 hypothetical protein PC113_g14863 [Phytophthora cactorum]KAG2893850.1 hypothetical protein PC114_g16123 [Phytophthora cactorum]KAG2909224.1 hypothetical protein PC115_g13339 [Phytophthora cactorum]
MGVASTVTQEHVDTVKHQRDGSYQGKEQFRVYLEKTKIEGKWEPPAIEDGDDEHVVVRGVVKVFYIPISVKSTFSINDEGCICNIHTSKA